MGLFNFFRKKQQPAPFAPSINGSAAWQENTFQAAETFREPLSPLTGLMPQISDRPQSFSAAETQAILAKLDTLSSRLEQVNMRLEKIEQALRAQQPQQAQQQSYQVLRRW